MRILIAVLLLSVSVSGFAKPLCKGLFTEPKLYSNDELAKEMVKNLIMVVKSDRHDKVTLVKTQITTLQILTTHVNENIQEKLALIIQILSATEKSYANNPERFSDQLNMALPRIELLSTGM